MCWGLKPAAVCPSPDETPSPLLPSTCFPHHHCPQRAGTAQVYRPPVLGQAAGLWVGTDGFFGNVTTLPSISYPITADSVTVFTGQCFVDDEGNEILKTMWLLRSQVDNIKDDWKATR